MGKSVLRLRQFLTAARELALQGGSPAVTVLSWLTAGCTKWFLLLSVRVPPNVPAGRVVRLSTALVSRFVAAIKRGDGLAAEMHTRTWVRAPGKFCAPLSPRPSGRFCARRLAASLEIQSRAPGAPRGRLLHAICARGVGRDQSPERLRVTRFVLADAPKPPSSLISGVASRRRRSLMPSSR